MKPWSRISPETVSDLVSFDSGNFEYQYSSNQTSKSIADKQTEGVAGIWNLLCHSNSIALLADEVGMGKTFQALAVCSLLWRLKPDARILVFTPNESICEHWKNEYETFVKNHYKYADHYVKNSVNGSAIHTPCLVSRIEDVSSAVKVEGERFVIAKISSLSNTISSDNLQKENPQTNEKVKKSKVELFQSAKSNGENIRNYLQSMEGEESPFDLIVVDEAQYFRKASGISQKIGAMKGFLGTPKDGQKGFCKLSTKVLLLTATPSHSSNQDLTQIVSLFNTKLSAQSSKEHSNDILSQITVRRLRLLSSLKGEQPLNKYNYREEKDAAATFDDIEAELFFAQYQRDLAMKLNKKSNSKSITFGYLEGFESLVPQSKNSDYSDQGEKDEKGDIHGKAEDTDVLAELTNEYYKIYKKFPNHPKYSLLVNDIMRDNPQGGLITEQFESRKHLIFVRRVASTRELTQRINRKFDREYLSVILKAWGVEKSSEIENEFDMAISNSRKWYKEFVERHTKTTTQVNESIDDTDENQSGISKGKKSKKDAVVKDSSRHQSFVLDLFSIQKKDTKGNEVVERTHASNFRLRFSTKVNLFVMFFQPPSDYVQDGYSFIDNPSDSKQNYLDLARQVRLDGHSSDTDLKELLVAGTTTILDQPPEGVEIQLRTFWSIAYPYLSEELKGEIKRWSKVQIEDFCKYFEAGILYASPALIELYVEFIKLEGSTSKSAFTNYNSFLNRVENLIKLWDEDKSKPMPLIFKLFQETIQSFVEIRDKLFESTEKKKGCTWGMLRRPQHHPAWFVDGSTGSGARARARKAFNSPFFPYVLTSTSVFQEGVNLHYNCKKIHHYGLAGNVGSNEQRTGRVDRLYGQVHREVQKIGSSELQIHYPYLKNSFDEIQVASFLQKKAKIESNMDKCIQQNSTDLVDKNKFNPNWKDFLGKPDKNKVNIPDPYPPEFPYANNCEYQKHLVDKHKDYHLGQKLQQRISRILVKNNICRESELLVNDLKIGYNPLLLVVDSEKRFPHNQGTPRVQPIFVEKFYHEHLWTPKYGMSYGIRFKTPIFHHENSGYDSLINLKFLRFYRENQSKYPLTQLCYDMEKEGDTWELYLKSDILVIPNSTHGIEAVSSEEVCATLNQVQEFADYIEYMILEADDKSYKDKIKSLQQIEGSKEGIEITSRGLEKSDVMINKKWQFNENKIHSISPTKYGKSYVEMRTNDLQLNEEESYDYIFNHLYPFINKSGKDVFLRYLKDDLQESEQDVLVHWFEWILDRVVKLS